MSKMRWQDWGTLVVGIWLGVSPWVLGFSAEQAATWNALILGVAMLVYSIVELSVPKAWEEWAMLVAGIWLLVSPWVLGFTVETRAAWDTAIVGVVAAVLAVWALAATRLRGTTISTTSR
jgi:SPW repeat